MKSRSCYGEGTCNRGNVKQDVEKVNVADVLPMKNKYKNCKPV
jgi:hypothetical protein